VPSSDSSSVRDCVLRPLLSFGVLDEPEAPAFVAARGLDELPPSFSTEKADHLMDAALQDAERQGEGLQCSAVWLQSGKRFTSPRLRAIVPITIDRRPRGLTRLFRSRSSVRTISCRSWSLPKPSPRLLSRMLSWTRPWPKRGYLVLCRAHSRCPGQAVKGLGLGPGCEELSRTTLLLLGSWGSNWDVAISSLTRNMTLERPQSRHSSPKWDLSVVLRTLMGFPPLSPWIR
jgi:hypothetical protein